MKGIENFITFIEVAVFAKKDTFKKLTNIIILASIIGILIIKPDIKVISATKLFIMYLITSIILMRMLLEHKIKEVFQMNKFIFWYEDESCHLVDTFEQGYSKKWYGNVTAIFDVVRTKDGGYMEGKRLF
ncbi:Uncharacterised protein [uncultured Clostridium sp.]|nr:Uncharacterised protein [uncultured Clostridium sp.]